MTEAERGDDATRLTRTVGERLRAKREALGLSLAEVAARTRVPLRHLEAIEAADFAGLPSATYAVGFVRAYARAVDEDEIVLARDVRAEVARVQRPTPRYEPYEIADPSRVPSRGLMIVAAGIAIAVLVLAGLWLATGFGRDGQNAGTAVVAIPVPAAPAPVASPTPAGGGQVALTATDELWMEVYESDGKRLFTGTMRAGQTFDVPPDAKDPMINIGRPDKLSVTLNGSKVAPLGTGERAIKDVRIGAAALTARASGTSAPVAEPSPIATSGATRSRDVPPAFAQRPRPRATPSRAPASRATGRPRPRASPSREGPENLLPSGFATDRP
ncbi:DUF4115 domain-containing protein [Sphingomonas sp. SUN019]|uniref:helix-turn-helix domain-containing protein n=1 Tax=Sphingomonas sp. SUN019 TaxID=2937788 RepID=UPI0021648AFE|nr:RodZ domain-containing protein [Sphingomonas sp. SUN019]UVO51447.1 DUF4115 domain-containing protein [Sphingomonas sp. SUN019]